MKRKKLFLNLILAALGTVSFLGACEKKDDTSESTVPEPVVYEDGDYTLLDFENQSDLYKTRIYTEQILDIYGKVEIYSDSETAEEKHVISGNSSLKYSVTDKVAEAAHYKPGLLFFFGKSAYPDLPVERFASTSLMLSSSAEKNIQVTMSVVSTKKSLFSEEFTVKKGRNNELKLAIDSTLTMFRAEDVYAVCIEFPECTGYDFYIDDWKVTLEKNEETEEQKAAKAFVNKVSEIENSGAPTAESLLDAYNNYNKLGKACRAAVEAYYNKFTSQISSFLEIKSWEGTSQKIDILSLSENYGILQLDEVGGVEYVYNEKVSDDTNGTKFIFEKGGTYKIPFEIATIVIGNYDYLTFTIKNSFNAPIIISFNDSNNKFTVDADSTKTAEMLAGDLNETENHITIQIDAASRTISSENAIEMVLSSVTANALPKNDIKYTLGENCYNVSGGAKLSKDGEKFSVAITDTSARLVPLKEISSINVAQNVSFEMSANTNVEATFYDVDGNKITSAFLTTDLTLVTLSKEEYEGLAYISFNGSANVAISNMLLTRVTDKDYAETLFYNDYIVKADKITSENIREAFYYVSLFESMYGYKQNKLKEQSERVYNDIIARAGKVSEIFMNSISKLENNTATETDYLIIGDMYDRYLNLKSVTPLSGAQKKFVNANKEKFLKYRHTVFEFDDLSTVYNFGFNSQFWDNNVNFSVENVFDSKKLVANITRVATDESITGNTYRVYITYKGTVSSDYDYIVWNIYNPTDHGMSMYFVNYGWSSTVCGPYSLGSGKWTEVKISAGDYANAGQFVVIGCNIGDKLYFDDVYCYSHVIAQEKINELPDADHLTDADGAKVFEARKEYNKLSSAGKRKVNATKLLACEEKLNKLSERTIINMSDSNVLNRFSVDDYLSAYKWIGNIYQTTDSAKGGVLAINIEKRTGKQNVIYAKYDISGIEISSYKTVKFSIYNPLSVDVSFALINDGNWTTKSDLVKLQSGKWTEIEVSVETFLKCAHFYFGSGEEVDFSGQTFLISDIIASKE